MAGRIRNDVAHVREKIISLLGLTVSCSHDDRRRIGLGLRNESMRTVLDIGGCFGVDTRVTLSLNGLLCNPRWETVPPRSY